jgi:hypothetical protein
MKTGILDNVQRIVTNGLVLNLDAGNPLSYPGSGSTWTDLSGNGNNGTLTNGPTFDSANGGSIVFDGTNDYVKLPNSITLQLTDFTLSSWIKVNIINADQFIIDTSTDFADGLGYSYRINFANKIRFWAYDANGLLDSSSSITNGVWYNVVSTYNNTSKLQTIYINGILDNSNIYSQTFVVSNTNNLQVGGSQVLGGYFNGNISQTMIYNRDLLSTEVLQNFNALKSRFGL